MRVQQSFVIAEPREKLWEFFEQVDQVAACVPGVESVEQVDADNSRIRMTQSVGPMSATFDLRMKITERRPLELMEFTAIGRAVRGAAGNVRTTNTVRLADVAEGTRVELESELAMGGVLGSVGQKVIARQAGQVTQQFSDSLERAIKGEPAPGAPAPAPAPAAAANGASAGVTRVRIGLAAAGLALVALLARAIGRR
jgi:carbon monoxide dehydrogenase subunit G